ncbi:hypothetical protein ACJJIF_15020 [Microbulbifer sp. SSSA002]|uniref:hypothetical protein n=1 Tax=Microbulbifer sp. SSSA002 TaxID=3243376 RepID=UPI004039FFE8
MSNLINELENILKRYLPEAEQAGLDLSDDNCPYRKCYFEKLPSEAAKEALFLYPNGKSLYKKYQEILNGKESKKLISDNELCGLVRDHLKSIVDIMDENEDEKAIKFILAIDDISIAESLEQFAPGENLLHKYVYGAIGEFLLNELPNDDSLWLLYDWSLEKSKWVTVSAFFLEDFIDESLLHKKNFFRPGFNLWLTRNNNHYWAVGNKFVGNSVLCKAAK